MTDTHLLDYWQNKHRQLERDLAAAQSELVRERMAQTNVEMAHAQEKNELRQQLAAAQEARQAAEEDRDSARDRVKSLVLDLSAAVGRYQRAEERVRELENFADLMADEFQRIVVCCESGDTFVASEIIGLCQRAVKTTKQNVPVIVQRDRAEALAESLKADAERNAKDAVAAFGTGPFYVEHRTNACSEVTEENGKSVATCSWTDKAADRAEAICNWLNNAAIDAERGKE